jgi:3,4-dihydroxy-2-butanone 4-phosphate synthase
MGNRPGHPEQAVQLSRLLQMMQYLATSPMMWHVLQAAGTTVVVGRCTEQSLLAVHSLSHLAKVGEKQRQWQEAPATPMKTIMRWLI